MTATNLRKIGIYHHPELAAAREVAAELQGLLQETVPEVWISDAWHPQTSTRHLPGTDLLICIGGDGTVLRGARVVAPHPTLILGVDMGRFAFLTECAPAELRRRLPDLLAGRYTIEERTMLEITFDGFDLADMPTTVYALNDIILGRSNLGRPVYINVRVNRDLIGVLRADAVIVATATGSTGYSLSAGGPILAPTSRSMVITPVAPHLAAAAPLVLPEQTQVELSAGDGGSTAVSVDGQDSYPMRDGSRVRIKRSVHVTRMIRFTEKPFFAQMGHRLAWLDERRLRAVGEGAAAPDFSDDDAP